LEWDDYFELLLAYKDAFQHLRVPQKYATPDGVKLGLWVYTQRRRLKPFLDINNKVRARTDGTRRQMAWSGKSVVGDINVKRR
jgi:Helicase associated domain